MQWIKQNGSRSRLHGSRNEQLYNVLRQPNLEIRSYDIGSVIIVILDRHSLETSQELDISTPLQFRPHWRL